MPHKAEQMFDTEGMSTDEKFLVEKLILLIDNLQKRSINREEKQTEHNKVEHSKLCTFLVNFFML